jgi:hydrogenase maturation protease
MSARIVVVGVGNLLASDDGLGPRVVERLQALAPAGVECIDAATDLGAVLPEVASAARLIIVDAIRAGGEPGAIYRMTLDELLERSRDRPMHLSMHDMGLAEAVQVARMTGVRMPPTIVLGMEPAEVGLGTELSPVVRQRLDDLVAKVIEEIAR